MKRIFITTVLFFLFLSEVTLGYEFNIDFFKKFNDKYLEKYIVEAFENNHDLKQANYRVEQYRQEIKLKFAQELPSLSVGASYLGAHFPKSDLSDFFFIKQNSFILPFQVKYEPDFLLKTKDKTKSAQKLYKAQKANEKATYISLITIICDTLSFKVVVILYLKSLVT